MQLSSFRDHSTPILLSMVLLSTFWSDSQAVLYFISSEAHMFKVFVGNRVSYIRSLTVPELWRHVPSGVNPADVVSRGCAPRAVPGRWLYGPRFLQRHRDSWSVEAPSTVILELSDPEMKKVVCNIQIMEEPKEHPSDKLTPYYSNFYRLKKAVAWMVHCFRVDGSRAQ